MLTGYRDIISVSDPPVDDKPLIRKAKQVVEEALSALDHMRRREGAVLAKDLSMRVHTVGQRQQPLSSVPPMSFRSISLD